MSEIENNTTNRALLRIDTEHRMATFDADVRVEGDRQSGFSTTAPGLWSGKFPARLMTLGTAVLKMEGADYDIVHVLSDLQDRIAAGDPNRQFDLDDYRIHV